MVSECSGKDEPHVDDFVRDQREHVMLKELIKQVFGLVHYFLTHYDEQLSPFVGGLLP